MKKPKVFFVLKFGSTNDNDLSNVEAGIELKNVSCEKIKEFIYPYGLFFIEIENKFDCNLRAPEFNENKVVIQVQNLDTKHYTSIVFEFKQKLETMFETVGMYIKVL